LPDEHFENRQGWIPWNPEDDNAGASFRRESQRVGEIEVQTDQASLPGATRLEEPFIGGATEFFFGHRFNIMSRVSERILRSATQIPVEFELHGTISIGIST
jgi:hypothetical protein